MSDTDDLERWVRRSLARYLRLVASRLLDARPHERGADYGRGYRDGMSDAAGALVDTSNALDDAT